MIVTDTAALRFSGNLEIVLISRMWSEERENEWEFFNLLNTKRRLLYLKTQSVPRSKHFPTRL